MILQAARMPTFDLDPDPPLSARVTGRLTLVDDDELVHVALGRNIRGTGWSTTGFTDAHAALTALQRQPQPDLLIVDLHMPRMNGDEMLDNLAARWRSGSCRTYLCSAVPPPEQVRRQVEKTGAALLAKETLFDRDGLRELLGAALEACAPAYQAARDSAEARRSLAGLHPK